MDCFFCKNRKQCSIHDIQPGVAHTMLKTGMSYSKDYQVYDPSSGEIKTKNFRSRKERQSAAYIEVDVKIGTCTKCGYFREGMNYHIPSRSNSVSVSICQFCSQNQFANEREFRVYLIRKLRERYVGSDERIINLLRASS